MIEIISTQDIIDTYPEKNQKLAVDFIKYVQCKEENPAFGYKRLSKLMNEPIHRTRYWHHDNAIPQPIKTVNWLKEKNLLPLDADNPKIELIAKILGTTFGDGGIFQNLNGIFLSSSELEAVKEFGEDLKKLLGNEIEENSRIIEGGEYGHSWCYQNTNRNIIRFFQALGAPIGDKSFTNLIIPQWIHSKDEIENEFFGSFFGNELGVPKVHISRSFLDTLSVGITASQKFENNRIEFLLGIAVYLNKKSIKTGKISINEHKKVNRKGEPTKIYRLLISTEFENVINFSTLIKINYCKYKQQKLLDTMNEFSEIKLQKFNNLISKSYSEEHAMKLLRLSPAALHIIQNQEDFNEIYN